MCELTNQSRLSIKEGEGLKETGADETDRGGIHHTGQYEKTDVFLEH